MDRRTHLKLLSAAASAALARPLGAQGSRGSSSLDPYEGMHWGRGFEGQRRADLGDGTFLNPIFAGDHPDPSILRDGEDYYVTFSSFDAYPGLRIWHSRDLVNWRPLTAALKTPIGSVWAAICSTLSAMTWILGPLNSRRLMRAGARLAAWAAAIESSGRRPRLMIAC